MQRLEDGDGLHGNARHVGLLQQLTLLAPYIPQAGTKQVHHLQSTGRRTGEMGRVGHAYIWKAFECHMSC